MRAERADPGGWDFVGPAVLFATLRALMLSCAPSRPLTLPASQARSFSGPTRRRSPHVLGFDEAHPATAATPTRPHYTPSRTRLQQRNQRTPLRERIGG